MKTAFLTHPLFLEHDPGPSHPENAQRLRAIEARLRRSGLWDELLHLDFEAATEADIARCHVESHIARVKALAQGGGGALDGDTRVSPRSFEAALLASGAAMRATQAVWNGEVDNAFAAVRPCGHHAESGRDPNSPWGFCLFNHVAVAARYAQAILGAERVAILDFDVHHGNGTQEIFYEDGSVFFASIHESPLFPGSGARSETGAGEGVGTTLNYPFGRRLPGVIYRRLPDGVLWRQKWQRIGRAVAKFEPQLIILSAGFDAHEDDPLAHIELRTSDFADLISDAKKWAQAMCGGKLVAVLEGGYNLDGLAQSVEATLRVLIDAQPLMKTLLLDDNLLTQTRVAAQLQSAGCAVQTRRALPSDGDFELVIVNLGSRSMPGLKLLEAAKMQCPDAKIWGFCGHLEVEIRRAALKIGVDKLLTNEVAMSELAGQIGALSQENQPFGE